MSKQNNSSLLRFYSSDSVPESYISIFCDINDIEVLFIFGTIIELLSGKNRLLRCSPFNSEIRIFLKQNADLRFHRHLSDIFNPSDTCNEARIKSDFNARTSIFMTLPWLCLKSNWYLNRASQPRNDISGARKLRLWSSAVPSFRGRLLRGGCDW